MLERIQNDFKQARLNKNERAKIALQLLITSINNKKIELGKELEDSQILDLIKKEIKNKKASVTAYGLAKRDDLVKQEEDELEVLSVYLPKALSYDELITIAKRVKSENVGVHEGKFIGLMNKETQGLSDINDIKRALAEA